MPQFSRILGRDRGRVYLIDAFAGRGFYGKGAEREDGSPVLAAKIASQLGQGGSYDLHCINVEADPDEFRDLADSTGPYAKFVQNLQGSFALHVDRILKDIGLRPSLFFLDPFGVGGLEWETLAKIGRRPAHLKTELLVNFNAPKFDRHAGWLDSFDQKPRQAFIRLLSRICGGDEWQRIWQQPLTKNARYDQIAQFYLGRVCEAYSFGGAAYPIRTVESGELKYYLLYFTRHPLGLRIMSSILYGVERRYLEQRAKVVARKLGGQLSLFDPSPPTIDEMEREDLEQLERDVLQLGLRVTTIQFGMLQDRLMSDWFGRMVQKHYREVCRRLVQGGRIVRDKQTGITDQTWLTFR